MQYETTLSLSDDPVAQAKSAFGILNAGAAAWAFAEHAERLARVFGVDVVSTPRPYNYVLAYDEPAELGEGTSFVPQDGIAVAADKREIARCFHRAVVCTPHTYLVDTPAEVEAIVSTSRDCEWCLKWPTSCGAAGHRLLISDEVVPENWPRPYVVQEFIRQESPEVFRTYGVGGSMIGWVVRRFDAEAAWSPWVAHARGAHYADAGALPPDAAKQAQRALEATGLWPTFGCVDLLRAPDGSWLVLEVGTDGLWGYVDRDLGLPALEQQLDAALAHAFLTWCHESY